MQALCQATTEQNMWAPNHSGWGCVPMQQNWINLSFDSAWETLTTPEQTQRPSSQRGIHNSVHMIGDGDILFTCTMCVASFSSFSMLHAETLKSWEIGLGDKVSWHTHTLYVHSIHIVILSHISSLSLSLSLSLTHTHTHTHTHTQSTDDKATEPSTDQDRGMEEDSSTDGQRSRERYVCFLRS